MADRAQKLYRVSERRACRILQHARATRRYESVKDDQAELRGRSKQIAGENMTWGWWGCLRIWVKLRREVQRVNKKRGLPAKIRVDNGSAFTGRVLDQWTYTNKVRLSLSRRG
jgi:transposase InsO family protein